MLAAEFAIKCGERVFSGTTLRTALKKVINLPNVSLPEKVDMLLSAEYGYLSDTEQFLSLEPRSSERAEE